MSSKEINENMPTNLLASLANEANRKIKKNKYILETIQIYQNQIKEIKNIFKANKEENPIFVQNDKNLNLFLEYNTKLKALKNENNRKIKILNKKIADYKNKLYSNYSIMQPLEKEELDNFILKNTLLKLNNDLLRYHSLIKIAKEYSIFQEVKRDIPTDKKKQNYLYLI